LEDPADLGSPLSYAVEVLAAEDDQDLEAAAGGRLLAGWGHVFLGLDTCSRFSNARRKEGAELGPHCSFCGTVTGPFSEIEGVFTVRICIPCLEVRQARPDTLLGLQDPGQPWEQWWGLPDRRLRPLGPRPLGPGGATPRPSTRAGRPPMNCCGRIRTSVSGSPTGAVRRGKLTLPALYRW
jgi:hypothetical protein